jgi:hypothetical protein
MRYSIAAIPAVLLLAACGGAGGGDSVALQPGQWETSVQFTTIDIPGAPPEAVNQMREAISRPQTRSECITPEQAANPTGNMMAAGAGNCQFSESRFEDGEILVRGTCEQPGSGTATMAMEGSYTPTTMEAEITSEVQAPAGAAASGPQSVRMSGTVTSRRTGDCPAS